MKFRVMDEETGEILEEFSSRSAAEGFAALVPILDGLAGREPRKLVIEEIG